MIHEHLMDDWIRGEWFEPTEKVLSAVKRFSNPSLNRFSWRELES